MDIPRQSPSRRRRLRQLAFFSLAVLTVSLIAYGTSRLKPAAPSVERSGMLVDTVKRGEMIRQVRGIGTLVPKDVRVIASSSEGRVERILVQPGTPVRAGTVLIELSNPELDQSALDATYQIQAAESDLNNMRLRLESDRMSQTAVAAGVRAEYQQAKIQLDTDEQLAKDGLLPHLTLKLARVRAEELSNRYDIEQKRLEVGSQSVKAQLAAQQTRLAQLRSVAQLKTAQVRSLRVLAGTDGVLQQMQVEVGQQINPGTNLARVVEPQQLKAELKIAETQAKDIQLGQPTSIDTRNGIIRGRVERIDPAVREGTVTVDVALEGGLPTGARPDLSVDGTIELEHLKDVLYVGRPAVGQAQSTIALFRLAPAGDSAVSVQVKLGRNSVNTVEVVEGLREGDQVILSDTSAWEAFNRILLH
jgi:HlyD family secretion protein